MKSSSLSIKQPTTRAAGTVVVSDEKEEEEEELVTTPTRGKRFFHRRSSEDGGENTKSSFRDRFTSLSRTSEDGNESEYSGFGSERGKHHHHRPKTKESGKYAEPNEEERKRMEYLKEQLVKHEMILPKTMTIPELGGEERTLLRFVRARTKGKELAWEMLRNTLKWRKKWHVDECLERSFLENEKLYDIVCSQNSFYVGHGKFGHPIYFDNVTNMPWKQILSEFDDVDTFLRTQIQTMEWQQEFVFKPASERVGYPITQVINIWNLRGMTLGLFTSEIKAVTKKPCNVKTRNKVHIMGHGKHVFDQLQKKLGPNSLLTAEMVQSKFKDIGVVERKLGFESAHKKSQDYIRKKLREKNQPFYPSHSVLEKRKEELEQFDEEEFFDASDEHWWTKSEKEIKEKCFSCFSCFTKKRVNELP
ncbi:unnamed protein product [Bathycoccus prasinos]